MTLKFTYDAADQIPEGKETLYTQTDDGKYRLAVEGAVDKGRLDEFRENNTTLRKQLQEIEEAKTTLAKQIEEINAAKSQIEQQYAGIDLEEISEMKKKQQDLADKKLIDEGKVDELIAERLNKVNEVHEKKIGETQAQYEERVDKLNAQIENQTSQLNKLLIDNEIANAATKHSVAKTALEDVMNRGRSLFNLQEGKVVAMEDGKVVYADDQVNPLSIEQWVNNLSENAPHLFEKSVGSGAQQSQGKGGANTQEMSSTDKISAGLKTMKR